MLLSERKRIIMPLFGIALMPMSRIAALFMCLACPGLSLPTGCRPPVFKPLWFAAPQG